MFHFQKYISEVTDTLTPLLQKETCDDQIQDIHDISYVILYLGYLLLLGEEHLESSILNDIWRLLPSEERLSLKACVIEYCRSSIS